MDKNMVKARNIMLSCSLRNILVESDLSLLSFATNTILPPLAHPQWKWVLRHEM